MADQVYLSLWLRGHPPQNVLKGFETALGLFPFSRLRPVLTLRVYALEFAEPPVLEHRFDQPVPPAGVVDAAREFENPDCAYVVESFWELWQWNQDWKLDPAPVTLSCFGPEFPSDNGEQLLLELGPESLYVPLAEAPGGFRAVESNIRSLLRLSEELREALPVEKLLLWSESGENLASRLEELLSEHGG